MEVIAQTAFAEITAFLRNYQYTVVRIEILPSNFITPEGRNIICDRNETGIPKSKLVLAFSVARSLLFSAMKTQEPDWDSALNASSVCLLWHPENFTAINLRKRFIVQQAELSTPEALISSIRRDLFLITSFLNSPLKRHTKSPVLWRHREWLIEQFSDIFIKQNSINNMCVYSEIGPLKDQDQDIRLLHDTLGVVCKAGELHQHNYYAWQYARRHVASLLQQSTKAPRHAAILMDIMNSTRSWTASHPSDTSGFSFLGYLLFELMELNESQTNEKCAAIVEEIVRRALTWPQTFESIWSFIRLMLAKLDEVPSLADLADDFIKHGSGVNRSNILNTLRWLIEHNGSVVIRVEAVRVLDIIERTPV